MLKERLFQGNIVFQEEINRGKRIPSACYDRHGAALIFIKFYGFFRKQTVANDDMFPVRNDS